MREEIATVSALPERPEPNIPGPPADIRSEARDADVRPFDPVPDLVERARHGDKDAFGQIYRLHHPTVARMARFHLGPDVDDVVAEVFLRAWEGLPRYRNTGVPFLAWLHGIARHVVWDEMGRRNRTEPREAVPDAGVEWAEDDRLSLAAAIERLPQEQRQVIELKFLLGMRNPEVAAAMGTSIGAVNAKQWRALQTLRDLMGNDR